MYMYITAKYMHMAMKCIQYIACVSACRAHHLPYVGTIYPHSCQYKNTHDKISIIGQCIIGQCIDGLIFTIELHGRIIDLLSAQ